HYGYARQGTNSEQPGLGQNFGRDTLGIPGTNGTRAFESGWPTFSSADFATIGVNENFMPYYRHDPQSQYVLNFNYIKSRHNIRFGADVYDMALNQTQAEFITGGFGAQGGFGFARGVTERCEAVNAAGNCQRTSPGSFYNSAAAFVIGQARSAGRLPPQCPPVQQLCPRPVDGKRQADDRFWHPVGVFSRPDQTRSRHRIL